MNERINSLKFKLIQAIKCSVEVDRLEDALCNLRKAEAELVAFRGYSSGGDDQARNSMIEKLEADVYEANDAALWAAEGLRSNLEDITQQFGMFFASAWGEGGAWGVWVAPELGWCCQPETQVAGFER